jgi:zinc/manganese transport system substrate-binding protein
MLNRRFVLLGLAAGVALPLPAFAQEKLPVIASFSILADIVRRRRRRAGRCYRAGRARRRCACLRADAGGCQERSRTPALLVVNGLGFEGWMPG